MKKFFSLSLLIIIVFLVLSRASNSNNYEVYLSRVADNLYRAENTDLYIETRYCYVYAYYQKAVVSDDGRLFFEGDGEPYDIEAIYRGVKPSVFGTKGVMNGKVGALDLILIPINF